MIFDVQEAVCRLARECDGVILVSIPQTTVTFSDSSEYCPVNDVEQQATVSRRERLQAVRRRDPDALAEFFEVHFDRLYHVAFRLVGEHALAEDVMQEVFLKIHRAADRIDPDRDPGPWLATLTRNACREQWRKRRRHVERTTSLDQEPSSGGWQPAADDDPERDAVQSQRSDRLTRELMRLPENLREVVVLREFCGLAHEEVASVIGARGATVRKRYSRAIAELKSRIQDAPV
jgi:RNA polymerase sigma-70 factor (ECF subfamily)